MEKNWKKATVEGMTQPLRASEVIRYLLTVVLGFATGVIIGLIAAANM
ncbi:MAG: hypothetical protein RSD95_12585 [Clostridia bacterium]